MARHDVDRHRLSIRPAGASDVRALENAERTCFVDPWPGQYFMAELFAPGRFQRVVVDPVGSLAAYLFTAWQYLDLHILKVATMPDYRRQGIGRKLMELAEAHCRDLAGESVTLEVRPDNTAAIALYRHLGFADAGRRPGYYANGDDALIMTKRIEW